MNNNAMQRNQSTGDAAWNARARYFNSGNAFALTLPPVPSVQFTAERDSAFDPKAPTSLIAMDLSEQLQTAFPATTPFALSRYMVIRAGESLSPRLVSSAQVICILQGSGTTNSDQSESTQWRVGDALLLPGSSQYTHTATEHTVAWLVTDEPVLSFLGLTANDPARMPVKQPVHYLADDLSRELDAVYAHPDADKFAGFAVVLSNEQLESTRNIHPTLTLALNSLPPQTAQRPHVHNSMALTMCINGEGCYSTIDGKRKDWEQHAVMVTPPGAVHSHHNDGTERMQCLIVQDGALYYHGRTMGFAFAA